MLAKLTIGDTAAGLAMALALALVAAIPAAQSGTIRLSRSEWACTKTRGAFEVRHEPNGAGGYTPKLVAVTVCTGWERR